MSSVNKKKYENVNLILKNSKVNVLLAENNLNCLINNEYGFNNKVEKILETINNIEQLLESDIKWIENEYNYLEQIEIKNDMLMDKLISKTEQINKEAFIKDNYEENNKVILKHEDESILFSANCKMLSRQGFTDVGRLIYDQGASYTRNPISMKNIAVTDSGTGTRARTGAKAGVRAGIRTGTGTGSNVVNSYLSSYSYNRASGTGYDTFFDIFLNARKFSSTSVNNLLKKINKYLTDYDLKYNFTGINNIKNKEKVRNLMSIKTIFGIRAFYSALELEYGARNTNFRYGADQGIFKYTVTPSSEEYIRLIKVLKNKYHMTSLDANRTMKFIDSVYGACTYGSATDSILSAYANNPELFYKKFGMNLYIEDSQGRIRLNSGELLLDMFITNNTNNVVPINTSEDKYDFGKGNESLFIRENGKIRINNDAVVHHRISVDTINIDEEIGFGGQEYIDAPKFSTYSGAKETKALEYIPGTINQDDITRIRQVVIQNLFLGKQMRTVMYGTEDIDGNPVYSWSLTNTQDSMETGEITGGHEVFVTGANGDGIIVSTWGGEYIIEYQNLIDNQPYFAIYEQEYDLKLDKVRIAPYDERFDLPDNVLIE